jgi:hypothetical protein
MAARGSIGVNDKPNSSKVGNAKNLNFRTNSLALEKQL